MFYTRTFLFYITVINFKFRNLIKQVIHSIYTLFKFNVFISFQKNFKCFILELFLSIKLLLIFNFVT